MELERFAQNRKDDLAVGRPIVAYHGDDFEAVLSAMAAAPGPGTYPPELEKRIQRLVEAPPQTLSPKARGELSEVLQIAQRGRGEGIESWMLERLVDLCLGRSAQAVKFEAAKVLAEFRNPTSRR